MVVDCFIKINNVLIEEVSAYLVVQYKHKNDGQASEAAKNKLITIKQKKNVKWKNNRRKWSR